MQIVAVGLNHVSAPLDLRERVAFVPDELPAALERLRTVVAEGFILSTCNRVEVYALAGHDDSGADALRAFLADGRAVSRSELDSHLYTHAHAAAVRHLFRVAAGVDSMVLGESEIAGQLRRALNEARARNALGPTLTRLGNAAVRAGREVRTHTAIARHPISLVSIGLRAAAERHQAAANGSVLVLGAGETAESVLRHVAHDSRDVAIAGRSASRAAAVGRRHGARPVEWADRAQAMARADLVVACASAPEPVVAANDFGARTSRPVVCLDLGVPRDIDPGARAVPGVSVIDVDDLRAMADSHRALRAGEAGRAEAVVDAEVARFMEWWRGLEVIPAITDLRTHAGAICDAEVERAMSRLSRLDSAEREIVSAMAQRIVGRLLHLPTTTLKTDAEGDNLAWAVRKLFHLTPPS